MSMLSERRRKQKWSLNPRGKFWAEDSNKFGQKLMEKMGWSQGKGLGARENGMTEHIKVSYKNDSQGIGYKETDEQWTEHQADFKAVLEALAGKNETPNELKFSSLEEKSQGSKVRVHYKKFTRGKDLSKRTEKDLACIFGKRNLKGTEKSKEVIHETGVEELKEDKQFSNAGLMSDYFKKKLPSFGKTNDYVIGNNGVLKKVSDDEDDRKPGFGSTNDFTRNEHESDSDMKPHFGFGFQRNINEDISSEKHSFTSKKNSSLKASFVSYISENNKGEDVSIKSKKEKKRVLDDSTNIEDTPSKKKKLNESPAGSSSGVKKKSRKNKVADSGLANPAFDPLYSSVKVEKHILESIQENSFSRSSNETLNDSVAQVSETFAVQVQINNDVTPVKVQRESACDHSKKRKKRNKVQTISLDRSEDMQISVTEAEELEFATEKKLETATPDDESESVQGTKKEKRKKKSKKVDVEENVDKMDISNINSETAVKSRKKDKIKNQEVVELDNQQGGSEEYSTKKRKTRKSQEGLDNPLFSIGLENNTLPSQSDNSYEVKSKPKKKKGNSKENLGVENPMFNCDDSVNNQDLLNEEFEVPRKDKTKKKKRKDKEDNNKGLDNPALNLDASVDESLDLMLNVVTTPSQSTQSENSTDEFRIQRVKKTERRKSVRFSDVTRERIIPNKEEMHDEILDSSRDIVEIQGKLNDSSDMTYIDKFIQKKKAKKGTKGLENIAFDEYANNIEENITSMTKTLDNYQAEIENDMNEAKMKSVEIEDIMIGEVGNPEGPDEKLPDGSVKLKFKNANFKKRSKFMDSLTGAKKSYHHLIKGDIVIGFKESNLHEIHGYGVVAQSTN